MLLNVFQLNSEFVVNRAADGGWAVHSDSAEPYAWRDKQIKSFWMEIHLDMRKKVIKYCLFLKETCLELNGSLTDHL